MEIYWRDNFLCPTEEEYRLMISRKTGQKIRSWMKCYPVKNGICMSKGCGCALSCEKVALICCIESQFPSHFPLTALFISFRTCLFPEKMHWCCSNWEWLLWHWGVKSQKMGWYCSKPELVHGYEESSWRSWQIRTDAHWDRWWFFVAMQGACSTWLWDWCNFPHLQIKTSQSSQGSISLGAHAGQGMDWEKCFRLLGLYFQIRDDYANLRLPSYAVNKSFAEDLTEG